MFCGQRQKQRQSHSSNNPTKSEVEGLTLSFHTLFIVNSASEKNIMNETRHSVCSIDGFNVHSPHSIPIIFYSTCYKNFDDKKMSCT